MSGPEKAISNPPGLNAPPVARWVEHLGVTGALIWSSFAFLGVAGANAGIALMLLALLLDWRRFWHALRSDPILPLLLWTMAAMAVGVGLRTPQLPVELLEQLDGMRDVLQLFLFLPLAWWLGGQQRLILWCLALALAGFVLGVTRALDGAELTALVGLQRPNFIWSINAFGQYAAAILLAMTILTPRFWRFLGTSPWRWPGMLGWLTLMALAGAGAVLSLSRGVWLATAIVGAGLLLYYLWSHKNKGVKGRKLQLAVLVGIALLVGALSLNATIRTRVAAIAQPITQLWVSHGHAEKIKSDSDRLRAELLVLGLKSWRESPWLGLGPKAARNIIRDHRQQFPECKHCTDFHNLAVDMLVSFGVVGSPPLLLTFLLVLWVGYRGYRAGRLDRDVYLVLISLLLLSALAQMTDTRILSSHGRFYSMLLAGGAYSWWLASSRSQLATTWSAVR